MIGSYSAPGVASPGSRLWATGGVTTIEGSAGGGLTPWALLSGYADDGEWGGSLGLSTTRVDDFSLTVAALSASAWNRVEVSFARQHFDLDTLGAALGQDQLEQDIFGIKMRLAGDLIYTHWGQWSLGVQHKRNRTFAIPSAVGARDDQGTDLYLTGSKLWLAALADRNLLLNAGIRATKANQGGLLGFGGDRNNDYEPVFEGSLGVFLTRQWLIGAEYRQKPDNLGFAREDDWYDAFVAWVPSRDLALTAAWVNLGDIAGQNDQRGLYLALQGSF
ncbi:MAG: DUF3034 family protein [Gammaproteobacteria bacterium]|nr:DUF3034 family protein [Gammaproteobacteria bacterium]